MHHPNLIFVRTRVQPVKRRQRGFSLIEAMIALLIFGTGVLGIARLQAVAVQETSTAAFRTMAALQARNLIATMWLSDRTAATLATNFTGPTSPGAGYTAWLAGVTSSGLPAATAVVAVAPKVGGGTTPVSSSLVTITVSWKAPGDPSGGHSYTETAQLK